MRSGRIGHALGCALSGLLAAVPASAACRSDLPRATQSGDRDVSADDLARLRDIGPADMVMYLFGSPFGVSPDGHRLAFQIRQGDPVTNRFCLAMVMLDLRDIGHPRIVDRGGDLIRWHAPLGALADYPSGEPKLITPIWSPDGSRIAFLKHLGRHDQVWIADLSGRSRPLSRASANVEAFAWTEDGKAIVFRSRPALAAARAAITVEGKDGYLYDDRWGPRVSNHPWPGEPIPYRTERVLLNGVTRAAFPAEVRHLDNPLGTPPPDGASWFARSGEALAWVAPADKNRTFSEGQLRVGHTLGRTAPSPSASCDVPACRGNFQGLWWAPDGRTLWFLHREGWAESETALYSWVPGSAAPVRVFATRDRLGGCQPANAVLVCALEESSRPRRIVTIDPASGRTSALFDSNPDFSALRRGTVERLEWRNNRGIEIFADLVIPPDRTPGKRLPLVIVQYQTRGFLRGGTGDEFPIFALAAHGFAVLSMERPGYVSDIDKPKDADERIRRNYEDWADRRSVMDAYASGIALLDKRGLIDPARVGITGLSDGTASAQFALVNSHLFAAASLSACCEDPKTLLPLLGNNGTRYMRKYRYPAYTDPAPDFWRPYSIAANAATFRTPLLLQAADDEYMLALETYASLREYGAPVEMVVFPDEHHVKWQPAHRLAIYRRNLAWFSFWLKDDAGLATPLQQSRWSSMRNTEALLTSLPAGGRR